MIKIDDFLLLRTANLPFEITALADFQKDYEALREAIYFSGLDINTISNNQKDVLYKYKTRMLSRPTPFGLFSSVIPTGFNANTSIEINHKFPTYQVALDSFFESRIIKNLESNLLFEERVIYTNSTLFKTKGKFRYTFISDINGKRNYITKELVSSKSIGLIFKLCFNGCKYRTIKEHFNKQNIDDADLCEFLSILYKEQIIITDLEIELSGENSIFDKTDLTQNIELGRISMLPSILTIKEIKLDYLKSNIDSGKLLLNITSIKTGVGGLNLIHKNSLKRVVDSLIKLAEPKQNIEIDKFKRRYIEVYENKALPLLEALDPDLGIGYSGNTINHSLIGSQSIESSTKNESIDLNNLQLGLFKKLISIKTKDKYEPIDIEMIGKSGSKNSLPNSFSVLFRVIENNTIFIESLGGKSAINLLARFGHSNESINSAIQEIKKIECNDQNCIAADIIFSPEASAINILRHSKVYDYEIPILTIPNRNAKAIALSDLYLRVENNRVVLFSKKLNKIIKPRLTSAYNYPEDSYYIFKFLCDLESQDVQTNFNLDFNPLLKIFGHIPRLLIGDAIVYRATWYFEQSNINDFEKNLFGSNLFVLVDFDNELLFDITQLETVEIIKRQVKNKESFIVAEYLFDKSEGVVHDKEGNKYVNQFVGTIYNWDSKPDLYNYDLKIESKTSIKRIFGPGSEWLYVKVYLPISEVNSFIIKFSKIFKNKVKSGQIKKWFFIRYYDTNNHIRVRFNLDSTRSYSLFLDELSSHLNNYLKDSIISSFCFETYIREIERYGSLNINLIEEYFYHDSIFVENLLKLKELEDNSFLYSLAMCSINTILDDFGADQTQKLAVLEMLIEAYRSLINTEQTVEVKNFYRENVQEILKNINGFSNLQIIKNRTKNTGDIIKKLKCKNIDCSKTLIPDLIHMNLNRIFNNHQNLNELITYMLLIKYLKTIQFKD